MRAARSHGAAKDDAAGNKKDSSQLDEWDCAADGWRQLRLDCEERFVMTKIECLVSVTRATEIAYGLRSSCEEVTFLDTM